MGNNFNDVKRPDSQQRERVYNHQKKAIDENNYVEEAEKVINSYGKNDKTLISTSQLRKILAMLSDIYTDVVYEGKENEPLSEEIQSRIKYLKVHCIYATREKNVKTFLEKANIIEELGKIGKDRKRFILFSRYMEALVAYRKYFGKDE